MCAIKRSSAASARCAAKCAICGLKQQTRSAVASTIARQNSNIASGLPRSVSGRREGSGSSPTQSSELVRLAAASIAATNAIGSGELAVLDAMRLRRFLAKTPFLVFLVFVIVAGEEFHVRITFEGEDVRGDAIEEPAVVRDHERAAGKFE